MIACNKERKMDRDLVELLEKAAAQYERGRLEGWTPDDVHDYRVAIRRTRAYLKFWRGVSPRRQKEFRERLRMLQRQTAFVREWDVFYERFSEALAEESIQKGAFARFVQIQGWNESKAVWDELVADGKRLKGQPPKDLQEQLRKRTIREAEKEEINWHRLRIRVKRLRYELERHKKSSKERIQTLKAWQDRLGLIQDTITHQKWFVWLGEEESLASLGNQAMREKLVEEARRDLPQLIKILHK